MKTKTKLCLGAYSDRSRVCRICKLKDECFEKMIERIFREPVFYPT